MSVSCSPFICAVASISLGITWLVFIPFSIYIIHAFYLRRHYSSIRCRNPQVTLFACGFNLAALIVHDTYYYLSSEGLNVGSLAQTSDVIVQYIFPPFFLALALVIFLRVWVMFYELKFRQYSNQHDWQSLLLADKTLDENFYTKNKIKNTLGNWKFMLKILSIYWVIGTIIDVTATALETNEKDHTRTQLVYIIVAFPSLPMQLFCWYKLPLVNDLFVVRNELKSLLIFIIILISIYFSMVMIGTNENEWAALLSIVALSWLNFGIIFISTFYVLYKTKMVRKQGKRRHSKHRRSMTPSIHGSVDKEESVNSSDRGNGNSTKLSRFSSLRSITDTIKHLPEKAPKSRKQRAKEAIKHKLNTHHAFSIILGNDNGINSLCNHLKTEFALENLLGYIELTQWLRIVSENKFCFVFFFRSDLYFSFIFLLSRYPQALVYSCLLCCCCVVVLLHY